MNSKNIGNNYEREIAKKLSLWLSQGKNDDICWRDLGSGLRATVRSKQNKDTTRHGDFVPTDLNYKWFFDAFCVDSKSYKEWNPIFINNSNMKSNSIFNQWIKVISEAQEKIPMMVCKIRDRKTPDFVILPSTLDFSIFNINHIDYYFFDKKEYNCSLYILSDFFEKVIISENDSIFKEYNTACMK